jgi:hypothetical protein
VLETGVVVAGAGGFFDCNALIIGSALTAPFEEVALGEGVLSKLHVKFWKEFAVFWDVIVLPTPGVTFTELLAVTDVG